jgi:hypothetical protein
MTQFSELGENHAWSERVKLIRYLHLRFYIVNLFSIHAGLSAGKNHFQ